MLFRSRSDVPKVDSEAGEGTGNAWDSQNKLWKKKFLGGTREGKEVAAQTSLGTIDLDPQALSCSARATPMVNSWSINILLKNRTVCYMSTIKK